MLTAVPSGMIGPAQPPRPAYRTLFASVKLQEKDLRRIVSNILLAAATAWIVGIAAAAAEDPGPVARPSTAPPAPMASEGGLRLRGAPGVLPNFYRNTAPYDWRWGDNNPYGAGKTNGGSGTGNGPGRVTGGAQIGAGK